MFGVDTTEFIIVAVAALLFIGPKELPQAMRAVGRWVGKIRGMARHFSAGIEAVIREAELEEMEKKWREENERIMREHPLAGSWDEPAPLPPPGVAPPLPPPAEGQAPPPPAGEEDRRELP